MFTSYSMNFGSNTTCNMITLVFLRTHFVEGVGAELIQFYGIFKDQNPFLVMIFNIKLKQL